MNKKNMTVHAASEYLDLARSTLYRWIKEGVIPECQVIDMGRHKRLKSGHVEDMEDIGARKAASKNCCHDHSEDEGK